MRNKANLTIAEFTLTREIKGVYSNLHPKTKNGTKPIKANFFTTPNSHFSAELFSDTRLRQGVPASVLTYVEDCSAAVKRSSREKKPLKSPRGAKIKKMKSKPNPKRKKKADQWRLTGLAAYFALRRHQ